MVSSLSYSPNERFDLFWNQLKKQAPGEWNWLIGKFRARLIPWLRAKTHTYPTNALQMRAQFIEEVFEETLFKFYDLFKTGTFTNYGDLEATVVTVCGYKLKEGFARLKKEQRMYLMESDQLNYLRESHYAVELSAQQREEELLVLVYHYMDQIDCEDRKILTSFFAGQELRDIAQDLSISPAACRKRKQRALDTLRRLVFQSRKAISYDQHTQRPTRFSKTNIALPARSAIR